MIIASIEDYRKRCEARLPRFLYDYISGGSYQENTLRGNIADLRGTMLRQRVMVDESHLNLSIDLWDQVLSLPVVLGPVGMAGMYSSRGEVKAANAAKAVGVPFTLSTMGVCDVHEVAQKSGVPPWFQLYMLKDRGFVKGVIERSVSAGSKVLVFTVDLPTPGRRYSEVHDGMEKDPTLLGMLGFVAQGAMHPFWALDIVTKGWPLKFGTIAGAMPKRRRLWKICSRQFRCIDDLERHRMDTVNLSWKDDFERHSRSRRRQARSANKYRRDFGIKPRWQAAR
jgi:L-lactate dehydrogenase (cytochrome)